MKDLILENIKTGDRVVAVSNTPLGIKYNKPVYIMDFYEKSKRWTYTRDNGSSRVSGAFPLDGGCKFFMSKSKTPDYWFSANPFHLKEADKQAKGRAIARDEENKRNKLALVEFNKEFEDLLNKHGVEISAEQISGDDQGVEFEILITKGMQGRVLT